MGEKGENLGQATVTGFTDQWQLYKRLGELKAEYVDGHYYTSAAWFRQHADRYDKYSRNGPKIFAGEYAAQSGPIGSPDNKNIWDCAISEAAFMTGLERNADVVVNYSSSPRPVSISLAGARNLGKTGRA